MKKLVSFLCLTLFIANKDVFAHTNQTKKQIRADRLHKCDTKEGYQWCESEQACSLHWGHHCNAHSSNVTQRRLCDSCNTCGSWGCDGTCCS